MWLALAALPLQRTFSQGVISTNFPKEIQQATHLPAKEKVWIFLLAGQSNMAGRGLVEPRDTLPNPRILTVNQHDEIVLAKEPLHYYEPTRTGLDCGMSFAKTLLMTVPADVSILVVPAAVGGSSIQQWLGDSTYREVRLLTNMRKKIAVARKVGVVKGILWHQGETNAMNGLEVEQHADNLKKLATIFRDIGGDAQLPFLMAELGSFSKFPEAFMKLNAQLVAYAKTDPFSLLIRTSDLKHKGDSLHFDAEGQRQMGERFASEFTARFLTASKK